MNTFEYGEGYVKDGQLRIRNTKTISQDRLTSDCWLIQINGLSECKNCPVKDTEECGGGETLKRMLNERI